MSQSADKAALRAEKLQKKAAKQQARQQKNAGRTQKKAGQQPPGFWQNPISYLFYFWYTPLLWLGYRRPIQWEDEFALPHDLETNRVHPHFESEWRRLLAVAETTPKGREKLERTRDGKIAAFLWKTLWARHKGTLMASLALQGVYSAFNFAGPVILNKIVTFLQNWSLWKAEQNAPLPAGVSAVSKPSIGTAYLYSVLIFVFPLIGAIALVHSNRVAIQVQIRLRAQLTSAVYLKALRLSSRARQQTETGRVVNLMSNDVNNVMQFFYPFFSQLFIAPAILVAALVLLWFQIKWATFIGLAMLLLTSPATGFFVKRLTHLRKMMLKETDQRVKLMNQLLAGIRVLKLYAWESAQEAMVLEARRRELGRLRQAVPARVGMQVLLFSTPTLAAVFAFAAYGSAAPNDFTAPHIFSAIAYFAIMRFPLIFLPFALVQLGNAMTAMRRLSQFLIMEERADEVEKLPSPGAIITEGNFYWSEAPKAKDKPKGRKAKREAKKAALVASRQVADSASSKLSTDEKAVAANGEKVAVTLKGMDGDEEDTDEASDVIENVKMAVAPPKTGGADEATWWLRDINMEVKQGQLVCIVGRVGSGKSSLLSALLGEMQCASGRVAVGGSMAYVAQQAWIINDTVENNVLLGQELDQAKWDRVVKACSLEADLAVLPAGRHTEIGERGVNLSGGQKARVSMARAMYADTEFIIMDDPLSAVDVHVGRHMFNQCIRGALEGKTRLLVTNQLQYLPQADQVIYLEDGRIAAQGSYEQVRENERFVSLLQEFNSGGLAGTSDDDADSIQVFDEATHQNGDISLEQQHSIEELEARYAELMDANPEPSTTEIQVDTSDQRIGQRIGQEYLGAAPRVAAQAGVDRQLTRLDTFKVGAEALEQPLLQDATDDESDDEAPHDSRRSLASRHSRQSQEGGSRRSIAPGFLSMPTFVGQRSGDLETAGSLPPHASRRSLQTSRKSLHDSRRSLHDSRRSLQTDPGSSHKKAPMPQGVQEGDLILKEDREEGQIGSKVYLYYARAYGFLPLCMLVVCWSSEQSLNILTNWWLSKWTQSETERQIAHVLGVPFNSQRSRYIGGYFGFAMGFTSFTLLRSTINLFFALGASRKVHQASLNRLVGAPISFFDTTPVGRVLNRFSKDTDDMDYQLPQSVSELGNCLFQLAATLIFISIIQPYFLAGAVPLMLIYYVIQKFYRRSYIEMQRVDATTRSPIYTNFSETLAGVETLRAFGYEQRFATINEDKVDYNHRAYFALRMADQWLSWRLDMIASFLILIVALLAISQRDHINPSLTAVSLTQVLDVTGFLKYAVQAAAMFETRFNSVERLMAYFELPQEAPRLIEATKPADGWPTEGAITFSDVWMRYRPELDAVLRGVTFRVEAGQKIGIVGRTGSGKSSLIVALFRIVEPFRGAIAMDGIDLLSLGLDEVRGRIAAIPQDPVLFSGTVRRNLDPFDSHTDAEIWEALRHVNMHDAVTAVAEGLEARVAENGDNFSVGQRQLFCVARALLRRPKVLVADEATASVDGETDALIQRTIRANFASCTTLTIAHRINTILDSTKVLVMDAGRVKEFDTVPALMSQPNSSFRAMVTEAGLAEQT